VHEGALAVPDVDQVHCLQTAKLIWWLHPSCVVRGQSTGYVRGERPNHRGFA
jgi:hypothetical protein